LFHRESLELGVVDEVEASHCTEPYWAVYDSVANGTTEPDNTPSVNEQVGGVVNPVVLQPVNVDPTQ
jgi:hypothetical protein